MLSNLNTKIASHPPHRDVLLLYKKKVQKYSTYDNIVISLKQSQTENGKIVHYNILNIDILYIMTAYNSKLNKNEKKVEIDYFLQQLLYISL